LRVILMAVGDDRPGLTRSLADAILDAGGNWLESHFARLGSKFVGSVLVELPDEHLAQLEEAVAAMDATGFNVTLTPSLESDSAEGRVLCFELVGRDRPGIVQEVSAALAGLEINIVELESSTEAGAMSGERLFRAQACVQLPETMPLTRLQDELERISGEIMVDFED
jgi:glycine cleavage system regulatory protein